MDEKRTLGDLPSPFVKRRVYTLTYSSDNRAVIHRDELQQIHGTLYRGRDETDSIGGISCVIYIYFEDIGYGVAAGSIQTPSSVEVDTFLAGTAQNRIASPEAYISWLNDCVEKKAFINNAQIALARQIAPERVSLYEQARLDYYAENRQRDEARRKAREEEDAAFCREENAKADKQVAKAIEVIRSGGELENIPVTHYRGRFDGMTCSIITYMARQYGVNIPISVQGWINRSLFSVIIKNGQAVSYCRRRNSKSGTFGKYMTEIIAAVQAAAENPSAA